MASQNAAATLYMAVLPRSKPTRDAMRPAPRRPLRIACPEEPKVRRDPLSACAFRSAGLQPALFGVPSHKLAPQFLGGASSSYDAESLASQGFRPSGNWIPAQTSETLGEVFVVSF
jgi:hypothetical protein